MKALQRSRLLSGAFLIFVAGATYACSEFLEQPPQGALDESTLATQDGVEGTLIASYRLLDHNTGVGGAWGSAASNWVWGSVTSDDAYKGSEASDQPPITDIELYTWSTGGAQDYLNDKWRHSYEGIVRANAAIKLLNKVVEADPDEISQADQDGIKGEAVFLRAHYHFEAWRLWENIPYFTEADTNFFKPNTGGNALASILSDLDEAIGLLPVTPRKGQVGRATAWTAKAYKGMVQMYGDDNAGALATLTDVRNNGPYALELDFSRVWTGFSGFTNGPETILAYQSSVNDGNPNGDNSNWGERLNFPHSGSPFGCCGFHQPSQNIVNFFQVDASGLPLALTDPNWNSSDAELDAAASAGMMLDPRLDWTVARDDVPVKDWGVHEQGWIRSLTYGGPYSGKKPIYESAAGVASNVGWTGTQTSSMNIHILRYADVLLLLAEAEVEVGSLGNACTIVNEIRTRAGVAAQGPVGGPMTVPIDDASTTWADYQMGTYACPFASQAEGRTRVRYERRLELAMEGQRFFDLKRWGIAEQVLNDYLAAEGGRRAFLTAAAAFSARHNLFPIPVFQIEVSGEDESGQPVLTQNTGW
jgi:hypothetical protein